MSDINTVYAYFDTYNYTGELSTQSYALPFAEFVFIPRLNTTDPIFSTKRLIWNFGDGTTTEAITARHAYAEPGSYRVSYTLYTGDGQGYINTFYRNVDVYDFIPDSINIQYTDTYNFELSTGEIGGPIYITNSIANRHLNSISANKTIQAFCSGSNINYFDLGLDKQSYGHLYPFSSFYLFETGLNQLTNFIEISSFNTITTPIYCKLSANTIVTTDSQDVAAYFCGLTGYQDVYFKSDIPNDELNLLFGYNADEFVTYSNTSTVGMSARVIENTSYDRLSITANGITSEGTTSELYPIGKNKFGDVKIGFVVRIKDINNFTNKSGPLIALSGISVGIRLPNGDDINNYTTTSANFGSLETLSSGGFFKGYIIVNLNDPIIYTSLSGTYNAPYAFKDVVITVSGLFNGNSLEGTSTPFNLYTKNYYNVTKVGEDIDMTQQFKDVAMQPLFLDNKILFDDFLGSIVGNISSNIGESLGKRTYEKIQNFVSNNSTLDYAGIQSLVSLIKQTGDDSIQFSNTNYLFPSEIGRLVDLLSINFKRLQGSANTFNKDFRTFGYQGREIYGKNIGEEVSVNYTVTAGEDLLAFEKYSGKFTYLNTYLPLCASNISLTGHNYALNTYNNTWGWGLVIPAGTTYNDISNYYLFYNYIPTIDGTITNNIINYNDITNTLSNTVSSYTEWSQPDGIISNILTNQLYTGLDLFN
jgi:hypothetical protein